MIESDPGLKYHLQELFSNLRRGTLRLGRLVILKIHATDIEVANSILTDTISERTSAAGVTIDSVLLKDGVVTVGDVAFDDATSDPVAVGDAAADGTEDSVARKDHGHATGGTAGGDLGGTYPNPTVDDGADSTAIHDNVAGEIVAITEKTTPVANDEVVVEDSAASNVKKSLKIGNIDHDTLSAGTIASHDTSATGAQLDTLTDTSDADALHNHPSDLTPAEHTTIGDGAPHHAESHDYDTHSGGVSYAELEYDDATSDPLVDGAAAADGAEDSAARKDHVHPLHHAKSHDHTAADASGPMTNDEHDGYSEYDEIAAPGAGVANKLRVYSRDVGGVTALAIVDSVGVEKTFLARTRKLPLSVLVTPSQGVVGQVNFPDAIVTAFHASCPVPSDWVSGTALTLVIMVAKAGVNNEVAVMRSWISVQADTETLAWNIESNVNMDITVPASSELERVTRTVAGASVAADDRVEWYVQRHGDSGNDTLDEALYLNGLWLEYTAFF